MIVLSLFSAGAVGVTLLIQVRNNTATLSHDKAVATAQDYAGEIRNYFASYWYTAEAMAGVLEDFESIPEHNRRSFINAMMESAVKKHEDIGGIWVIWEPDVLEGGDQKYIGTPGTTEKGTFSPYWYRDGSDVLMFAIEEEEFNDPVEGYYYQVPKERGITTILRPYPDDVAGKIVLNTSVAVPLFSRDGQKKILGVIGIDIDVDTIQSMAQARQPFGNGLTAVFSNDGTIVAHFDPDRLGKLMEETERDMAGPYFDGLLNAVGNGELFYFTNYISGMKAAYNIVATPISIEENNSPWSYAIAVPTKTVMAAVNWMVLMVVIISAAVVVLVIMAAIVLSRSLTKPIITVTAALRDISEG
ncbi:MAG: hypothetical protein FWF55_04695, partial [Treponema sp.]|nr:hypothetical protein [Treponema sp.]